MDRPFDLDAYLRRIGLDGPPAPDLRGVTALHRAHVAAIPFENLDIQCGAGVRLDPASVQAKLVDGRRGGYCFEQNALFAMALRALGVAHQTREARVRPAPDMLLPRTHMLLTIALDGREWLADVGFGADGLVEPVPTDGEVVEQLGRPYRVEAEGPLRVLQASRGGRWEHLYAVLPEPVYPIDFEMANWFTSTWPGSRFVQTVTAQRIVGGARHVLRNLTYTVTRGDSVETREITRGEVVPLLRSVFGLEIAPEARLTALDGPAVPQPA